MADKKEKFVGVQVSPISFLDEGIPEMMDRFVERFGINALMVGTLSWLGLKVGRRISWEIEGWPDHGIPEHFALKGGSYIGWHPEYYANTSLRGFQATDDELKGKDILDMVIPEARKRGMLIYPEVMEPLFKYAGHGSAKGVDVPNMPQMLEVDVFNRFSEEPCINNPDYRNWWYSIMEDYARNYDIDGIMWCNERRSPLDNVFSGGLPNCFCKHCRHEAIERGIDVERVIIAFKELYAVAQQAIAGAEFVDGALVEFLRVLYRNPEVFLWERYWVERNKDMDRELYGIVKWVNPNLKFGLNVWNRNHFNPIRKAQWPWDEMATWSDWVKPITYQHQSGGIFHKEMTSLHSTLLRDLTPQETTPLMYKILGLNETEWDKLIETGLDPDTYVFGQCADAVRGVKGNADVYMGIGVDAPRSSKEMAICTPDIIRRSVLATYNAGGKGVVYSPSYAGMNFSNLDGGAEALKELGLF
ncbi:MAG: hypothetical protein JEZ06_06775 [Anaerolineaceae bacterium]|nr:hypothetical protein [Anaerolineaceae bacterium]